jgi:hypothetical protein
MSLDVPDPDTWLVSHPGYPDLSLYLIMTLHEKPQFGTWKFTERRPAAVLIETWKFTKRKKGRSFNWDLENYLKEKAVVSFNWDLENYQKEEP